MSDKPKDLAVGIDLGTTHSVVAHLDAEGRPWTVNNAEGDTTTPSVVFFDRDAIVVGKEAVKAAAFEPESVAQYAKRDVGRVEAHRTIRGEEVPPEVVQALVLRKLRDDDESGALKEYFGDGEDPREWKGVKVADGRVTELNLRGCSRLTALPAAVSTRSRNA